MAAPNIIGATTINGKTTGANLTTTSATTVISNAAGSGKCFKINTLNVSNYSAAAAGITINFNTGAALSGTNYAIAGNILIPANSTLNLMDKTTQYYLEENTSIGAIASTATAMAVTVSYEDIS